MRPVTAIINVKLARPTRIERKIFIEPFYLVFAIRVSGMVTEIPVRIRG
jgi:hypothetical protein